MSGGAPAAVYRLDPRASAPAAVGAPAQPFSEGLRTRNAFWFCRLRWLVIAFLAALGTAGSAAPDLFRRAGIAPPSGWPLVAAVPLAGLNAAFYFYTRRLAESGRAVRRSLWIQIVADLVALTFVVHHAGSIETGVAHAYLFHIVLTCIFFSRRGSLGVTVTACALYLGCVGAEFSGLLPGAGIHLDGAVRRALLARGSAAAFHVACNCAIWIVVWYLASTLTVLVQERNEKLFVTNRRLVEAQREKTAHMLRTTHELKAPFAAVDANVQLLLKGLCGPLTDDARAVLARVSARSRRLSSEITQMLQLANLDSKADEPDAAAPVDLAECVRWSIGQARPVAGERGIEIKAWLAPGIVLGVSDHLKMMFDNLIGNAINYSHRGGLVRVVCRHDGGDGIEVSVEDAGIGIAPGKLPRIFDEYYRTEEAVRHNKDSTGLGLSIVKRVIASHGATLVVESRPGRGTRFALRFPEHMPDDARA